MLRLWFTSTCLYPNLCPHSQTNGLDFSCFTLTCVAKFCFSPNDAPQYTQWNARWSSCTVSTCRFRFDRIANTYPHLSHLKRLLFRSLGFAVDTATASGAFIRKRTSIRCSLSPPPPPPIAHRDSTSLRCAPWIYSTPGTVGREWWVAREHRVDVNQAVWVKEPGSAHVIPACVP